MFLHSILLFHLSNSLRSLVPIHFGQNQFEKNESEPLVLFESVFKHLQRFLCCFCDGALPIQLTNQVLEKYLVRFVVL